MQGKVFRHTKLLLAASQGHCTKGLGSRAMLHDHLQISHQQNKAIVSFLSGFRLGILITGQCAGARFLNWLPALHQLEKEDQTNVAVPRSHRFHELAQSHPNLGAQTGLFSQPQNNLGNIDYYTSFFSSPSLFNSCTPCGLNISIK